MGFVNVGVNDKSGNRVSTKKKMRELIANAVETEQDDLIFFDQTSVVQSGEVPGTIALSDLKPGTKLSVVGPDPYTKRNWYATVEVKSDGKVKVS